MGVQNELSYSYVDRSRVAAGVWCCGSISIGSQVPGDKLNFRWKWLPGREGPLRGLFTKTLTSKKTLEVIQNPGGSRERGTGWNWYLLVPCSRRPRTGSKGFQSPYIYMQFSHYMQLPAHTFRHASTRASSLVEITLPHFLRIYASVRYLARLGYGSPWNWSWDAVRIVDTLAGWQPALRQSGRPGG